MRVVPITIKESKRYLVQYEKLSMFCFVCGLMGHEMIECGDGVHDVNKCRWGDWLQVKFGGNNLRRGAGRGSGPRGGFGNRGRGRGRGTCPNANEGDDMDIYEEQNNDLLLLGASNTVEVENNSKKVQERKRQTNEEVNEGVAK